MINCKLRREKALPARFLVSTNTSNDFHVILMRYFVTLYIDTPYTFLDFLIPNFKLHLIPSICIFFYSRNHLSSVKAPSNYRNDELGNIWKRTIDIKSFHVDSPGMGYWIPISRKKVDHIPKSRGKFSIFLIPNFTPRHPVEYFVLDREPSKQWQLSSS